MEEDNKLYDLLGVPRTASEADLKKVSEISAVNIFLTSQTTQMVDRSKYLPMQMRFNIARFVLSNRPAYIYFSHFCRATAN